MVSKRGDTPLDGAAAELVSGQLQLIGLDKVPPPPKRRMVLIFQFRQVSQSSPPKFQNIVTNNSIQFLSTILSIILIPFQKHK